MTKKNGNNSIPIAPTYEEGTMSFVYVLKSLFKEKYNKKVTSNIPMSTKEMYNIKYLSLLGIKLYF